MLGIHSLHSFQWSTRSQEQLRQLSAQADRGRAPAEGDGFLSDRGRKFQVQRIFSILKLDIPHGSMGLEYLYQHFYDKSMIIRVNYSSPMENLGYGFGVND